MLAKRLAKHLEKEYSIRFLTRKVTQNNQYLWDLKKKYIDPEALKNIHFIIHLAGASIAEKRWTKKRKESILSSRVSSANLILEELKKHKICIDAFISASAVGYYGTTTTDLIYNEETKKGNDFLSDVCSKWELAAHDFKKNNVTTRVAILRIGVILDKNEGALKKITLPIKYGLGAGIGSGNQYMPWIHIQDLCNLFHFVATNNLINGVFNAVSPTHTTNIELTKKIGKLLNKPVFMPNIPKFVFQVLYGEMSTILLNGSKVSSNKILKQGFNFYYANIDNALCDLLQNKK